MNTESAVLSEAREVLLERTKSHYKKEKIAELTESEKEIIKQVLKNCHDYFSSIKEILGKNTPPFAWTNPERDAKLLICLEEDAPNMADIMDYPPGVASSMDEFEFADPMDDYGSIGRVDELGLANLKKSKPEPGAKQESTYLSKLFVPFETKYLQKVLVPTSSIIRILPYLLVSYYIETSAFYREKSSSKKEPPAKGGRSSCFDLFDNPHIEDSSNCNRMAHEFVDFFSLENLIPRCVKKKRTGESKSIQGIKTSDDYKSFLGQPYKGKKSNGLSSDCISQIQYNAIFQAFAFSLCVVACMNTPQLSEQIDYKQSFDLFQQHTYAFSVVFTLYSDNNNVLHYTIEQLMEFGSPTKIRSRIEKSEYLDIYKQCGVETTSVKFFAKKYSQEWYRNVSVQLVYELHPCEYLAWWNIDWWYKLLNFRLPFKQAATLSEYFSVEKEENSNRQDNGADGQMGGENFN